MKRIFLLIYSLLIPVFFSYAIDVNHGKIEDSFFEQLILPENTESLFYDSKKYSGAYEKAKQENKYLFCFYKETSIKDFIKNYPLFSEDFRRLKNKQLTPQMFLENLREGIPLSEERASAYWDESKDLGNYFIYAYYSISNLWATTCNLGWYYIYIFSENMVYELSLRAPLSDEDLCLYLESYLVPDAKYGYDIEETAEEELTGVEWKSYSAAYDFASDLREKKETLNPYVINFQKTYEMIFSRIVDSLFEK